MTKYQLNSTLLMRELDGETIALDLGAEEYFSLNETAARALELFAEPSTDDDVLSSLLDEFEVEEDLLRADMEALFADFRQRGFLIKA